MDGRKNLSILFTEIHMNSRDRRNSARTWRYDSYIDDQNNRVEDCFEWLNKNLGSCRWVGKHNPRWCWRPDMGQGPNFVMMRHGVILFFRKEKDYLSFLLKWG